MGATLKILGNIDKKVVAGQRRGVIRQLYKKGGTAVIGSW